MQVSNQKNKTKRIRKSQLLLIGSFLVFIGVVCLSWNHLTILKQQLFEDVKIKLLDDDNENNNEGTSEEIEAPDVENVRDDLPNDQTESKKPNTSYHYIGYLEIPRIGLKKGFVSKNSKYNDINYNVTIAQGSTYPDVANGNFILMAHSGDAYISYFANLYRLKMGNIAKVTYDGKEYKYKLVKVEEQPKTGVVAIHRDNYNTKALTLITCTKDNDTTQTIYIFELV